jgi:hypothetical protein
VAAAGTLRGRLHNRGMHGGLQTRSAACCLPSRAGGGGGHGRSGVARPAPPRHSSKRCWPDGDKARVSLGLGGEFGARDAHRLQELDDAMRKVSG